MKTKKLQQLAGAILAFALLLAGCSEQPKTDHLGNPWQESWQDVGGTLGVEAPEELTFLEVNDSLALSGISYASWYAGEKTQYENSEGVSGDLYDVQVYLLLQNCSNAENAAETMEKWRTMESNYYSMTETEAYAGFQCCSLVPLDESPYGAGYLALLTFDRYALSVELMVRDGFAPETPSEELFADFLSGIHFRETQ